MAVYEGNMLISLKHFGGGLIPAGASYLTAQFTQAELLNATKIKIVDFKDTSKQNQIFDIAPQIER